MTKQALIYERPVPITKERHGKWAVRKVSDYGFASELNAVPLVTQEFTMAGREYPVVFTRAGEKYVANALLGLRDAENLIIEKTGKWLGSYVPAFLRRYPFVFSHNDEQKTYTFCIDEDASVAGEHADGQRLFDDDGNETSFFDSMLSFTKRFQKAVQDTEAFCSRLQDLDLIVESEVSFTLPTGEKARTKGFSAVDRDRLNELEPDVVDRLFRSGDLELIHMHLASLRSFDDLLHDLPKDTPTLN